MPSQSISQQQMFGMAHALQTGRMPLSRASGEVRQLAARMDPDDVSHFAKTKHKGLPEHKEASGQNRFLAMVRKLQSGQVPLAQANGAVATAAKTMMPIDATASPAPAVKNSFFSLLNAALVMSKLASVESALAKAERSVQTAASSRRKAVSKQVQDMHRHNEQLVKERQQMEQKLQQTQAEGQNLVNAVSQIPPEMPPAQPPYGQMLMQSGMAAEQSQGGGGGGGGSGALPAMPSLGGGSGGKPGMV